MGGVNDRGSKPTKKFDSSELARLTKPSTTEPTLDEADEAFREWDEQPAGTPYLHAKPVTQPPRPTLNIPAPGDLTRSRTATVHDPFTTGLLAEVARRSQTTELSPDQIKAAASEDDLDHEDEDKTPPVTSPRIIRR